MKTFGLCHVALNVSDPQRAKEFYTRVLKMTLEWEPDADNVYLTSAGQDNLALHKGVPGQGSLDHIGYAVPSAAEVDEWFDWVKAQGAKILREPKTHRDGARSFYLADPDGIAIQIIHHPSICKSRAAPDSIH